MPVAVGRQLWINHNHTVLTRARDYCKVCAQSTGKGAKVNRNRSANGISRNGIDIDYACNAIFVDK